MTLLHITASSERAFLVTDSVAYQPRGDGRPGYDVLYGPDGQPVTWNKPHVLASMCCLLMTRGVQAEPGRYVLNALRGLGDFDQAVQCLIDAMPGAPGAFTSDEWGSEFHLIGWSEKTGQVRIARFDSEDGYQCALRGASTAGDWYMFSPEPPADQLGCLPAPQCVADAAALARAAVAAARALDPQVPFGGHLVVAEVSRYRVALEVAGGIGLPPRRPNADDVVGLRSGHTRAGGAR